MLYQIDRLLNTITMYKLLLWGLRILTAIALIFSFTGTIQLSFTGLALSLIALLVSCYASNHVLARIFKVPANTESYVLTALIMFLILPPVTSAARFGLIFAAGVIAMASKFLLNFRGKHIFNPAAFAAALFGVLGIMGATWWVGNTFLWPITLIIGLLVVRKIRRFALFLTFALVSLLVTALTALSQSHGVGHELVLAITSSPLLFLGTIMLTEPATMPSRRHDQIVFAVIVAVLSVASVSVGPLVIYPEVALLIGNIYAFFVSPRYRLRLTLERVEHISDRVANYVFRPNIKPAFAAGQYMEWTLDFDKHDSRGNRRTLSVASSPTEENVQIGVKFYEPSSRFKRALKNMQPGDVIYAGQLAGDFILPANQQEKLALIAGGIGVTPIRSMLKYIVDTDQRRDVIVIYAVTDPAELAYTDVLQQAREHGVRIVPLLTNPDKATPNMLTGQLDARFISERVPDFAERTFYISGPEAMVQGTQHALRSMGVRRIRTDHFSGY